MSGEGERAFVAIDLGAGSGRVMLGRAGSAGVSLEELHRFPNGPRRLEGHWRWDTEALWEGVLEGLSRLGARGCEVASLGVDSWGVDYVLLDEAGEPVEEPIAYRDERTEGVVEEVERLVPRAELFARNGLQVLRINTIYQLFAHRRSGAWPERAHRLAMIPDWLHHRLGGVLRHEVTNASTTGLLRARARVWDRDLIARLGLPVGLFGELVPPGARLGALAEPLCRELGLPPVPIVAPATHDTASAVAGSPLEPGDAYVSSGTWSLVGIETPEPCLQPEVLEARLTNEAGVAGRNRLLANVSGLWVFEGCRRCWAERGELLSYEELERELARGSSPGVFVDPDHERFFHPEDMVAEVVGFLRETGQQAPTDQVTLSRVVLESLALRYAATLERIERATGECVRGVRVVGGGSRNAFLDQATANACGRPVRAGPEEATAVGNVAVQAMAAGVFADLEEARAAVRAGLTERTYEPSDPETWTRFRERFRDLVRV